MFQWIVRISDPWRYTFRIRRARKRYALARDTPREGRAAGELLLALQDLRIASRLPRGREERCVFDALFANVYAEKAPKRTACELRLLLTRYLFRDGMQSFFRMELSEAIALALDLGDPLLLANIRREWEGVWPERFAMLDAAFPGLSSF